MTHTNIFMCGKCVCVCVCGHLHVVTLNVKVKTDTGYLSQLLSTLIFAQDMSLYLELINLVTVTGQATAGMDLSPLLPSTWAQMHTNLVDFLCGCWRAETMFSYLSSKDFIDKTIYQTPLYF